MALDFMWFNMSISLIKEMEIWEDGVVCVRSQISVSTTVLLPLHTVVWKSPPSLHFYPTETTQAKRGIHWFTGLEHLEIWGFQQCHKLSPCMFSAALPCVVGQMAHGTSKHTHWLSLEASLESLSFLTHFILPKSWKSLWVACFRVAAHPWTNCCCHRDGNSDSPTHTHTCVPRPSLLITWNVLFTRMRLSEGS